MPTAIANYALNLFTLLRGDNALRPLIATYYATTQCNLNCAYCEYFGARRNAAAEAQLTADEALRVLRVVRSGVDRLIVTGGEPLLHPEIDDIILRAGRELHFNQITLLTNGSLLHQHEALLPALDRLVISLDTLDAEAWRGVLNTSSSTVENILNNLRRYAAQQRAFGYRLIVNCVVTPSTLDAAMDVLAFCERERLLVSFSPQAVNNWPHYELLVSEKYRTLIETLIDRKRRGAPILGSFAYLESLRTFTPYACYPLLVPRIMPDGELVYPCRPIERGGTERGGRPCNLLDVSSWREAIDRARAQFGAPPETCASCFQQCFAEASLLQAQPLALLRELAYAPSRRGSVWTHAPG